MRPVQQSLVDPSLERPVGPVPRSIVRGNNSDLITSIAPLYLTGSVLDVTYGRGMWWNRFTPEPFAFHDLAIDGVDFTGLPELDDSVDAVCFDPPYIASGGVATSAKAKAFRKDFGVTTRSQTDLWSLVERGTQEVARVARYWVLIKCGDFVDGGGLTLGHVKVLGYADAVGLTLHDLIIHDPGRPGPGGHNIYEPKRARRAHSYLLVFRKAPGSALLEDVQ